jgi:hypothetical protein
MKSFLIGKMQKNTFALAIALDTSHSQTLLNLATVEYKDGNKERATELMKRINPANLHPLLST